MKTILQANLFGEPTKAGRQLKPEELPKALNDWGHTVYVLLNLSRPITNQEVSKKFGIPKFQSRISELRVVYPNLIQIQETFAPKRLGGKVRVNEYSIKDKSKAIDIYMNVLQKDGAFYKLFTKKKNQ